MIRRATTLLCLSATLIGSAALAPAASAKPTAVDQAFGNTIVSTYPDGRTGKLWLKPGGDYSAEGRRGDKSSGHWSIKGAKLCLKQSKPMAVFIKFCTPVPQDGLGHSWSAKAVTGEQIRVQMVKGQG